MILLLCSTQIASITRSCEYCNYNFVLQDVNVLYLLTLQSRRLVINPDQSHMRRFLINYLILK